MADTPRDGRDGRTNGGSANRPDRGRLFGLRFWPLLLGLLDDLPFLPTGTGPARSGRLQARGAPAAIGERFGQAIVRPDGWKRLTAHHGLRSRQRGA
jgi:hypothetical protein